MVRNAFAMCLFRSGGPQNQRQLGRYRKQLGGPRGNWDCLRGSWEPGRPSEVTGIASEVAGSLGGPQRQLRASESAGSAFRPSWEALRGDSLRHENFEMNVSRHLILDLIPYPKLPYFSIVRCALAQGMASVHTSLLASNTTPA